MIVGAAVFLGVLAKYLPSLIQGKSHEFRIKMGEVQVSVKGPVSKEKADEVARVISQSHVLEK